MEYLHTFCQSQTETVNVWYIHSKGVSRSDWPIIAAIKSWTHITAWRKFMEYFLITKYQTCVEKLETYDTCGANLRTYPQLHYSGNFWWATSDHIKKLPSRIGSNYLDPEMWICSVGSKHHCLHESGVDHYRVIYSGSKYKN